VLVAVVTALVATAGASPVTADVSLTKSDSPDPVNEGGTLTYTLRVANAGTGVATNTRVTDDLDSQVDPGPVTTTAGSCDVRGKKVECELGNLASGAKETVTIQATPKKDGQLSNTATAESDTPDPNGANNQDTETTTVLASPAAPSCKNKAATIVGTAASETLTGTAGRDVIVALAGDDVVNSGEQKDLVCAGDGNDKVNAGADNDRVSGNKGRDKIKGKSGHDELRGNANRDTLKGNSGNDLLAGGGGDDRCKGGTGNDTLRSC
jgi:uncharacterized repeat protein (TIGR01451 family)